MSPPRPGDEGVGPPTAVTGRRTPTTQATVFAMNNGVLVGKNDRLAIEEPLEIRLLVAESVSTISITMRTPGNDFELVAGFLLSEGVIGSREQIHEIAYCLDGEPDATQRYNVVTARLVGAPGRASIERLVMTSSACGICGSASIEAVHLAGHPELETGPVVPFDVLSTFPDVLRSGQAAFSETGGVHGIGLFNQAGEMLCIREDVGRHNAVDKVLGWAMLEGRLPLSESILMVSGRVSFEIVQKALQAGVPIVAAVSAATSLAVGLAENVGMTLVGFLRGSNGVIYSNRQRIGTSSSRQ